VRAFDTIDEAFAMHARPGQYLATSIWTKRPKHELAARARACGSGLVHFNSVLLPSAHPGISISGHGQSGWGPSRGESGLFALTREVFVTQTDGLVQVPVGEPSEKIQQMISNFIMWPLRSAAPREQKQAQETRPSGKSQRTEIKAS
jgi:hypothetical protein